MYESSGTVASLHQEFIHYRQATGHGQSGGSILVERKGQYYAVGVHVAGNSKE
jgi:V8-like Glu-specific endopeptidase